MNPSKRITPILVLLALAAAGCAKKTAPTAPSTSLPEEKVGRDMVAPPEAAPAASAPRVEGDPLSGPLDQVNEYLHRSGLIGDVYFEFDSPSIKNEAASRLRQNAAFMKSHPEFVFTIEGHCDERDTIEYNLALGQRRADVTRAYLSDLQIGKERLNTISYGKERPVCETSAEDCWSQNRRAHFVVAERR